MMSGWIAADALDADARGVESAEGVVSRREPRPSSRGARPRRLAVHGPLFRALLPPPSERAAGRRAGASPSPPGGPLVVYSNHPAWWDAAVYVLLARHLFGRPRVLRADRCGDAGEIRLLRPHRRLRGRSREPARRRSPSCAPAPRSWPGPSARSGSRRRGASPTARAPAGPEGRCRPPGGDGARRHVPAARDRVRLLDRARCGGAGRLRPAAARRASCWRSRARHGWRGWRRTSPRPWTGWRPMPWRATRSAFGCSWRASPASAGSTTLWRHGRAMLRGRTLRPRPP